VGHIPVCHRATCQFSAPKLPTSPDSPVISCIGEGITEWQRFGYAKVFIMVPGVTVPNSPSIPLEENVLEPFKFTIRQAPFKYKYLGFLLELEAPYIMQNDRN
jgi:hypothetical protein